MLTATKEPDTDDVIDDSLAGEYPGRATDYDYTEKATQQADTAPAKDPIPPPSPTELRAAHYAEIVAESQRVEQARVDFEEANAETKRLKKEYEGLQAMFLRLTRRDPLQRTLLNVTADPKLANPPSAVSDEWRKLAVSVLDIKDSWAAKLADGKLETLGDLQDFWTAGKRLRDEIDGIGEASDAAIVDAFSDYGAAHPEVFGEAPAEEADESEDEDDDEDGEESEV